MAHLGSSPDRELGAGPRVSLAQTRQGVLALGEGLVRPGNVR